MTAAALPEVLTAPTLTERGKAERLVFQMESTLSRKKPRFLDLQAFVSPYSSNVEWMTKAYDLNAIDVLDETIFYARTTLGSFFASAMTNPSRVWSQWNFTNPDLGESQAAKDFLYTLNQRRSSILSQSNFYDTMAWVYEEWPTFGTAVVLIEEDEEDVVRYVPWGIGSYGLADDHKGNCIAISRRFPMTVRQVVERFATRKDGSVDVSRLSAALGTMVRNDQWETQVEITHLICPNPAHDPTKADPEAFPFSSYYWESGSPLNEGMGGFLAKEGYREWPAMVFRWKRIVGDPFGVDAPGIATLAANKSLQQMESDMLLAVEKLAKPPLVVPTELQNASLLPAARNAVNTRTGQTIGALHDTAPVAVQIISETQEKIRERIWSLWWTRLVLALTTTDGRERTAREIEEISSEKFLVLGRVVESAAQAFRVASEREFAIMQRRGFLPEVPPELENEALDIEYTSLLAIAQKSVGLSALERFGGWIGEMAKLTGDAGMLLKLDTQQLVDEVAIRSGVPPRIIRSDEDVRKIERAQADAMAAERQAQLDEMASKTVKNLSQAPTDTDSALTALSDVGGVA